MSLNFFELYNLKLKYLFENHFILKHRISTEYIQLGIAIH